MMAVGAVLCAMTIASCSSDDDGFSEKDYPEQIVGRWQETKEYTAMYDEWDYYDDEDGYIYAFQFNADGTGAEIDGTYSDPFTYTLSGSKLTLDFRGWWEWPFRIKQLSSNSLVMENLHEEEGTGDLYYFIRVQ